MCSVYITQNIKKEYTQKLRFINNKIIMFYYFTKGIFK